MSLRAYASRRHWRQFVAPHQASAKKNKKIGIQLYSVMSAVQKDPKASIERLADLGYNNVELVQWGGDTKVFGMAPADFKALCDDNGVKIVSTHSSIQEDPAKEAEIEARWRQLFEIQKACGGRYFVIPSYGVDYTEAGLKQMCDYFNRIGKIAAEYGLMLGYHNHSGEYNNSRTATRSCGSIWWRTPTRATCASNWTYTGAPRAARTPWSISKSTPSASRCCT